MKEIYPTLWFDANGEEAANFYMTLFPNSRIENTTRYDEAGSEVSGQKKGSVMTVDFRLAGQRFLALNGGPHFKFTPAVSLYVACKSEAEVDGLWKKLSAGGKVLMELQEYPWSKKYGWCEDRFGLSWQLIIADSMQKISPAFLFTDRLFTKGEEAINFWVTQIENSKIGNIVRDPESKTVMHAHFSLNGYNFVLMEGKGEHGHKITGAMSFVMTCKDQNEIDRYWEKMTSAGGAPGQCGWLEDKYGVSWQVVPENMEQFFTNPDPKKVEKVNKAMFQMKKLDIAKLKQAAEAPAK